MSRAALGAGGFAATRSRQRRSQISGVWTASRGLRIGLRDGFPLLAYAGSIQSGLALSVAQARPPLPAGTALLPLALLGLCLYARLAGSTRRLRWLWLAVATLVLGGYIATAYLPGVSNRVPWPTLVRSYETGIYVVAALLGMHCLLSRGRAVLVRFFAVGLLYGCVLESFGVTAGFFAEPGYDQYLPLFAAPVCTMLGWTVVIYTCVCLVEMLERRWPLPRRRVLTRALLLTALGLALDLQFDPVATSIGLWHWNPLLRPAYLGVPLLNYTAWFFALFGFGLAYYHSERLEATGMRRVAAFAAALPVALAAEGLLLLATMAILEGPRGASLTILRVYLRR